MYIKEFDNENCDQTIKIICIYGSHDAMVGVSNIELNLTYFTLTLTFNWVVEKILST